MRLVSDITGFDPGNSPTHDDCEVVFSLYPGLIRYVPTYGPGETFRWELDIASQVEQVDPTHITFALKPGFGWNNGFGPLTAQDVKYSYERIAKDNSLAFHDDWATLDRVDVNDDGMSGVLVLREPYVGILNSVMPIGRGSIVCKEATEQQGGRIGLDPAATGGPYRIRQVLQKQKLVLEADPNWAGKKPEFGVVEMFQIDDDKAAELAFAAGEIDYFPRMAKSSIPQYLDTPDDITLDVRSLVGLEWIGLNAESAPLDDPRVREALSLATDVDEILEVVYFGVAARAQGVVPPGVLGHRTMANLPVRDVERARALIEDAGHGGNLTIKLHLLNNTDSLTIGQLFQAQIAEIGVHIELMPVESGIFWSLGDQNSGMWQDTQLILQTWGFAAPDATENLRWFTCDQIGVWNWQRWCTPSYDELYQASLVEFDDARREAMFIEMQDILDTGWANIWITPGVWANAYRNTVVIPATSFDGRKYQLHHFKKVG